MTAEQQRKRRGGGWLGAAGAGLLAAAIAGYLAYGAFGQTAPLGVPIPPPPAPIFKATKAAKHDSSYLRRDLPEGWVAQFAPQPDGLPPLRRGFQSERLDYSVNYPFGCEVVVFPDEAFLKDGVDSQAQVTIDQPITAFKVTYVPRDKAKSTAQYAAELLLEMQNKTAQDTEQPQQVALPGATFTTLAYSRDAGEGLLRHRLYLLGMPHATIVYDFMLKPEHADEGERMVQKIMDSFRPGARLSGRLEVPLTEAQRAEVLKAYQPQSRDSGAAAQKPAASQK
jgi:hypothetical protein